MTAEPASAGTTRPTIGITAYWRTVNFASWRSYPVTLAPQGYVQGVAAAGGVPFLIPPLYEFAQTPELALAKVDGLLLTGGEDIDPALYGAQRHPATGPPNELRDTVELVLLRHALAEDIPILAVCRGAQLLNAAYGGDLIQDIAHDQRLAHQPEPGRFGRHPVTDIGGRLRELVGPSIDSVATYHHQSLDRIGEGLVVTGRAPDGTVEAIEDPEEPFCVGVLWHPDEDPLLEAGAGLFRGLVAAARERAATSTSRTVPSPAATD